MLVSTEDVTSVNLILYIIKARVIAVGDNRMALCLECVKVVYHLASEEGASIFERWLIDNHLCTLCLDSLHDALDGRLAEVVAVRFHRQAIYTYHAVVLLGGIETIVIGIAVIACLLEHGIGDIILASTVALHDCLVLLDKLVTIYFTITPLNRL